MKTKLTKEQERLLQKAYWTLYKVGQTFISDNQVEINGYDYYDKDILLNYGNGSVHSQIECALSSLECIRQEFEFT